MVDETTDVSNIEQLVFCIRFLEMNYIVMKNSLGYIAWKIPQQKPSSIQ